MSYNEPNLAKFWMASDGSKNSHTQSYWFYTPIIAVLFLGFSGGGALSFGVQFLNWLPSITNSTARFVLSLFGMGMLGATGYATRFWANDIDEAVRKPQFLPHFFDAFGYATTIIGGGVTGIVFVLAVQTISGISTGTEVFLPIKPSVGFFLSFCGGLFQFKVEEMLQNVVKRLGKNVGR